MTSPVSSSCSARLRPIARLTATMGVEQNSPIRTPGVPKTAVDAATARSQVATSWHPAATAVPCTAAITGWGTSWTARHHLGADGEHLALVVEGPSDHLAQVVARGEGGAGGPHDDRPHLGGRRELAQQCGEDRHRGHGQRVALRGPVQREHADAVAHLRGDGCGAAPVSAVSVAAVLVAVVLVVVTGPRCCSTGAAGSTRWTYECPARRSPEARRPRRATCTVGPDDIALFDQDQRRRQPAALRRGGRRGRRGSARSSSRAGSTSAILNAVVAERLPGPGTVFLNVNWNFRGPVRPGDEIIGAVEVVEARDDKPITTLRTSVTRGDGTVVLEGTAVRYTMSLDDG